MELGLRDRGALVVGATGGIGTAVSRTLVEEGIGRLALGVRDRTAGARLADELRDDGGTVVEAVDCDLADPTAPERCVREAEAAVGPLDVLVMAAGAPARGGLWHVTEEQWGTSVQTKLMGAARLMRAAIPGMVQRRWGRVVLVGGLNGRKPAAGSVIGGVINAGLANLTTAVAKDVGADGVTVNLIDPHFTRTGRWERLLARTQEQRGLSESEAAERILASVPRQEPVPPEEVAAVIALLVSDRAPSVTGSAIAVDGGAAPGLY